MPWAASSMASSSGAPWRREERRRLGRVRAAPVVREPEGENRRLSRKCEESGKRSIAHRVKLLEQTCTKHASLRKIRIDGLTGRLTDQRIARLKRQFQSFTLRIPFRPRAHSGRVESWVVGTGIEHLLIEGWAQPRRTRGHRPTEERAIRRGGSSRGSLGRGRK